ncbi:MAG TPA: HD domain-containing protein [Kofleriaceae bacterium]|nr:HD domain-containing protein [Kofleriaceae bacterium]
MDALAELLETASGGADEAEIAARFRTLVQDAPLTVLRIATAIARSRGAWPHESVTRACTEEAPLLAQVDPTAVRMELERCLVERDVDSALQWLLEVGVMQMLVPELSATVDLAQEAGRRHKDVWEHTKTVVRQAVNRPAVRWAALLHDIGKVPTRTFTRNGVHFHGHAEVGARMFDKLCRRIPFEHEDRKKIRFLIKHHLRSNQYSDTWTDNAVRRFARDMEAHLVDLLDLSRADITSKRPGRRKALLRQISELQDRVERLRAEDAVLPPLKPGIGNAIMERFGLPPSRRIGELKQAIEAAIEAGQLEPRQDDEYYLAWLGSSGLLE